MNPRILLSGLAFGEAPRWHNGRLWFSDMHFRRVMAVGPDGKAEVITGVPRRPSGLGWTKDGRLLVVSMPDKKLLRLDSAGLVEAADLSPFSSGDCNDMVVSAAGFAYVGNFGRDTDLGVDRVGPGEIVMVAPDGRASLAADNLTFPNGMVITPDGKTLIVAETFTARLTAFDIQDDGSLRGRRVWAALPEKFFPDGICLDAEGCVWAANAGAPEVIRVKEGGDIAQRIHTSNKAFACMLGGAVRHTLFIMTAPATDAKICRQLAAGSIEYVEVEVPGAGRP
jgi:sugar lactone lactonase YvrE